MPAFHSIPDSPIETSLDKARQAATRLDEKYADLLAAELEKLGRKVLPADADPLEIGVDGLIGRAMDNRKALDSLLERMMLEAAILGAQEGDSALNRLLRSTKAVTQLGSAWDLANLTVEQWIRTQHWFSPLSLTQGLSATEQNRIRMLIVDQVTNQRPQSWLRDRIIGETGLYGRQRAETIARTEVTHAFARGNRAAWAGRGVERVSWRTRVDELVCPICGPLHMQEFGVDSDVIPPAHARCRCWIVPAVDRDSIPELPEPEQTSAAAPTSHPGITRDEFGNPQVLFDRQVFTSDGIGFVDDGNRLVLFQVHGDTKGRVLSHFRPGAVLDEEDILRMLREAGLEDYTAALGNCHPDIVRETGKFSRVLIAGEGRDVSRLVGVQSIRNGRVSIVNDSAGRLIPKPLSITGTPSLEIQTIRYPVGDQYIIAGVRGTNVRAYNGSGWSANVRDILHFEKESQAMKFLKKNEDELLRKLGGDRPVVRISIPEADNVGAPGMNIPGRVPTPKGDANHAIMSVLEEKNSKMPLPYKLPPGFEFPKWRLSREIGEELGLADKESVARNILSVWSDSSNASLGALDIQVSARRRLGTSLNDWQEAILRRLEAERAAALARNNDFGELPLHLRHSFEVDKPTQYYKVAQRSVGEGQRILDHSMERLYQDTQEFLANNHLDTVKLYRGLNSLSGELVPGSPVQYSSPNAIESWTVLQKHAAKFVAKEVGTLIEMEVPAARIFGGWWQGYGLGREGEVLVMAGARNRAPDVARVVLTKVKQKKVKKSEEMAELEVYSNSDFAMSMLNAEWIRAAGDTFGYLKKNFGMFGFESAEQAESWYALTLSLED